MIELYGYPKNNKSLQKPLEMEEVSIQGTIDDIRKLIVFLEKECDQLICWAKACQNPQSIREDDFADIECGNELVKQRLVFLINLREVIAKYK